MIFLCVFLVAAYSAAVIYPARAAAGETVPAADIFAANRAALDYDAALPLNATSTFINETQYYKKYLVHYDSVNGERVPGFLYVPKPSIKDYAAALKGDELKRFTSKAGALNGPPWPGIFVMHWLQSDKSLADALAPQFVMYGYVVFAIDGVFKGEREKPGRNILEYNPNDTVANIRQQVVDMRRGADYLATLTQDVDINRLGFFGVSMGAITGAIAAAVEPRFKVVVLADGAADLASIYSKADMPEVKDAVKKIEATGYSIKQAFEILKAIDPLYYVPRISPRPVLMINGKFDEIFPRPAMESLHAAALEPKDVRWFDSGHILPINSVIILTLKWFKFYLK